MTFSYSVMAFCSLPCWTNFSAELSTFVLLNPNPSAIEINRKRKFYYRWEHTQFRLKYHIKTLPPNQQGRFHYVVGRLPYGSRTFTGIGRGHGIPSQSVPESLLCPSGG